MYILKLYAFGMYILGIRLIKIRRKHKIIFFLYFANFVVTLYWLLASFVLTFQVTSARSECCECCDWMYITKGQYLYVQSLVEKERICINSRRWINIVGYAFICLFTLFSSQKYRCVLISLVLFVWPLLFFSFFNYYYYYNDDYFLRSGLGV